MRSFSSLQVSGRNPAKRRGRIARWSYAATVAGAISAALLVAFAKPPFLPDLSRVLFDWYQRLDPREWDAALPVRIVDIDEESLSRIGQWPWPRSRVAEIVARLGELGAAAVAIDFVFAEPDASSPEQIVMLLQQTPGRDLLEQESRGQKSNDTIFAENIARARSDASVAGVEVQAQAIEQAVSGASLVRPDWSPGAELSLAVALAIEMPNLATIAGLAETPPHIAKSYCGRAN